MLFNDTYGFFILSSSVALYFYSLFTKRCLFKLNIEDFSGAKAPKISKAIMLHDTVVRADVLLTDSANNCYLVSLMDFLFLKFDTQAQLLHFKETNFTVGISEYAIGGLDARITHVFSSSAINDRTYLVVNYNSTLRRDL